MADCMVQLTVLGELRIDLNLLREKLHLPAEFTLKMDLIQGPDYLRLTVHKPKDGDEPQPEKLPILLPKYREGLLGQPVFDGLNQFTPEE